MCENIDDFNRGAALIMARLYRSFPVPILLQVEQLDDGSDLPADLRAARLSERRIIYAATLAFLADEGYVTFSSSGGPAERRGFANARLTSKGLATLSRTPDVMRAPTATIGDRLLKIVSDGSTEAIRQAIGAMLGG